MPRCQGSLLFSEWRNGTSIERSDKMKKEWRGEKTTQRFKHDTIHIIHASDLTELLKDKAKKLGLPDGVSIAKLTRMAIIAWANS